MESVSGFMSGRNAQLRDPSKVRDVMEQEDHKRRMEFLIKNRDKIIKSELDQRVRTEAIAENIINDLVHTRPITGTNVGRFLHYMEKYPEYLSYVPEYYDKVVYNTYHVSKRVVKNRIIQLRKLRSLLPKDHPRYHEYVDPDNKPRITRVTWRR